MTQAEIRDVHSRARRTLGWRVIDANTNSYVRQSEDYDHREYRDGGPPNVTTYNSVEKGPVLNRQSALRLLAYWLDCGYCGRIVRVMKKRKS
jgi:hypothetical protein